MNTFLESLSSKIWSMLTLPKLMVLAVSIFIFLIFMISTVNAQSNCLTFPETNRAVCGRFLEYWQQNGSLAQQGYPLSSEMLERSDTDGKTYTVQYFERAIFERHPENKIPYDVLLSLLGVFEYKRQWSGPYYPIQQANSDNPLFFKETGKTLGGLFRSYWETNGGLAQQGYPITNEFQERSPLNGELYTVQYFERAVFELHADNQPPYNVLLSQLGKFRYDVKYSTGSRATPTPITSSQDCLDTLNLKGTVIAQGTNTIPTGPLKLKSYLVEAVRLQGPVSCKGIAPVTVFNEYWRIVITADEPFYDDSMPMGIWLDSRLLGSTSGTEVGYPTRVYDLAQFQDGATIGIGFLASGPRYYLPETLQFNKMP